jgi:hypothetical protein
MGGGRPVLVTALNGQAGHSGWGQGGGAHAGRRTGHGTRGLPERRRPGIT